MKSIKYMGLFAILVSNSLICSADSFNLTSEPKNNISYAKDTIGGNYIQLENINGKTKVTDMRSGEFIIVSGELAGKLTDQQYTLMLKEERKAKNITEKYEDPVEEENVSSDLAAKKIKAITNLLVTTCSNSYSIKASWSSPTCYFNSPGILFVGVSAKLGGSTPSTSTLYIELMRDVPWWFDISYGKQSCQIYTSQYPASCPAFVFNPVNDTGYYYLNLSKVDDGRWAWGDYYLQN